MTNTPELLCVIEQNELHKPFRWVRLKDSTGVVALVADEKYGSRIAALWNMAEMLRLTTEEIEGVTDSAALLYLSMEVMAKERRDSK